MPALALSIQAHNAFDGLPARSTIRRWTEAALDRDAELVIRFVGAREGRHLNRAFRRKDYAPNVLTFDYESAPRVRADIVITVPVVRREARQQRKPFAAHLAHLIVHGVLHAQGLRHDQTLAARVMERREAETLARFGIANPYETEE